MSINTDTEIPVPLLPIWLRWLVVGVIGAYIFYVSIVTVPPETALDAGASPDLIPLDKWRHFLAYAAFGGSLAYATADWELDPKALTIAVIGTTVLYGMGIEIGQSLVPDRYFSIGDAYANALGGVLVTPWYVVRPYLSFASVQEIVS